MGPFLIDNNVISDFFSNALSGKGMEFIAEIIDSGPNISVITEIEALSWVNPDADKEAVVREFVADCIVWPVSATVVSETVRLRRGRKIRTPDAIIAGTAIAQGLTLISSDNDFENIPGLTLINARAL